MMGNLSELLQQNRELEERFNTEERERKMRENLMKDVAAICEEERKVREENIKTIMPDIKLWARKGELPLNAQPTFITRKKKIEADEHYK